MTKLDSLLRRETNHLVNLCYEADLSRYLMAEKFVESLEWAYRMGKADGWMACGGKTTLESTNE